MVLPSVKNIPPQLHQWIHITFQFIMLSGSKIYFFSSMGPCWNHSDVITLMVPCLPLPILLFNVPSIHLFFSAHLALFSDDGFLRWVAEGYFCVGSLFKLKSIEAPTPPCPAVYVNAKQNYVSSLVIMFPIWSTSFKWTINVYLCPSVNFFTEILKDKVIDDRAMMNWEFRKLSIR